MAPINFLHVFTAMLFYISCICSQGFYTAGMDKWEGFLVTYQPHYKDALWGLGPEIELTTQAPQMAVHLAMLPRFSPCAWNHCPAGRWPHRYPSCTSRFFHSAYLPKLIYKGTDPRL